jgi:AcrR family transcriptional regulator
MQNAKKKGSRRDEILACFERLVAQKGVNNATVRDIAKAMNLSIGTVYNEFKDKRELVTTLLNREIDSFLVNLIKEENKAVRIDDKLYVLTVIRVKMMNSARKNNESLFDYLVSEPKHIRYIGKMFLSKRNNINAVILDRLETLLADAQCENLINVDDVPETARIFLDAFAEYTAPKEANDLSLKERERLAKAMYDLMIFSLMMKGTKTYRE